LEFPISNTDSKAGLSIIIIGGQQAPNLVVFFYDLTRINKVDMVAIVEPRIGEVNADKVLSEWMLKVFQVVYGFFGKTLLTRVRIVDSGGQFVHIEIDLGVFNEMLSPADKKGGAPFDFYRCLTYKQWIDECKLY
jgi:hypothetical protein